MSKEIIPFERIRQVNPEGNEFWPRRDFSQVLGYVDYRHFLAVIEKARTACFNSGQRMEDHFVGIDEMIEIGKGGQRPVRTVMMSRYACSGKLKKGPGFRNRYVNAIAGRLSPDETQAVGFHLTAENVKSSK